MLIQKQFKKYIYWKWENLDNGDDDDDQSVFVL